MINQILVCAGALAYLAAHFALRFGWPDRDTAFSDEEQALANRHFSGMSRRQVRKILASGSWQDTFHGTQLTRQDSRVEALVYLAKGRAHVFVDGQNIAEVPAGSLIGELTCLDQTPATATAISFGTGRIFRLPLPLTARRMKKSLLPVILAETRAKMAEANHRAASHREAACKG